MPGPSEYGDVAIVGGGPGGYVAALAVQLGATADDLAWTTHAHPTLPEAVLEAAVNFRDAAIHRHSR